MNTLFIDGKDREMLKKAAEAVRAGEVVAFPTETVYGLGANALDGDAVKKIFEAKGRPGDNPLIVHIFDKEQIGQIAREVTPLAEKLMDAFMPGPITVIVKKREEIPDSVTAGLDTVGIRMPSHGVCREFLSLCDCPVAAPSANLSGSPSPTSAAHVINDMDGRIYGIIDGGDCEVGLESTVVDATGDVPVILRPGAVTSRMIDEAVNMKSYSEKLKEGQTPRAPGMKYRHYAPEAPVEIIKLPDTEDPDQVLLKGDEDFKALDDDLKKKLFDIASPYLIRCQEYLKENPAARIGIFAGDETKELMERAKDDILASHVIFYSYGRSYDIEGASHCLFDGLRHLDIQKPDLILAAGFAEEGLGQAYMNRLGKAAGKSGDVPSSMKMKRHDIPLELFDDVFTASVLFVGDNNTARSIACERFFTDMLRNESPYCAEGNTKIGAELYAASAGLTALDGDLPDKFMCDCMRDEFGVDITHMSSTRACPSVYDGHDLIITMHDEQAFEIIDSFPEMRDKVYSISSYAVSKGLVIKDEKGRVVSVSIPDPAGENMETYIHTAKALKAWLEILFPYIIKDLGAERI